MKPTEIKPIGNTTKHNGPDPDRLTPLLIWIAFFLAAGLAALVADLWLRPASDATVVQAIGLTPDTLSPTSSAPPPTPSASPTLMPTLTAAPTTLSPTPEPAPPTPPPCVPPDDWDIHIVRQGNTLQTLAQRYSIDEHTLMQVNCLNTNTIFIGQRIYVPAPPATATIPTLLVAPTSPPTTTPQPGLQATSIVEPEAAATLPPTLTPKPAFPVNIPANYLNIVLLGSDRRPGSGAWRTDSMIIVSADLETNVVRLLSIPRDLWVYIPDHGYNRINTADLWGELAQKGSGPDWVKRTIHHNLGIPIHYYVRIDFQGFIQIIDTVGGIDIDVDCSLSDIELTAGMHHMNGEEALRYARSRYSTSDFDRGRRQRKVLMALWDQALTLDIIPKLPELWRTMANSFQTDLTLDQVINLAYVGTQLRPQQIRSQSIGRSHVQSWMTPQGAAVLLPRPEMLRSMLEEFYAQVDMGHLDTMDKVHVRLLNGSQRREAEQLAAAALRWAGFEIANTGLADHQDYAQTQIIVYNGDLEAAEQIARELRVSPDGIQNLSQIQEPAASGDQVSIQVILGRDYNPCQK